MQRTICLYCGSRPGGDPAFSAAAAELGAAIAARRWRLVYGAVAPPCGGRRAGRVGV